MSEGNVHEKAQTKALPINLNGIFVFRIRFRSV